jgi:hypothetical protein
MRLPRLLDWIAIAGMLLGIGMALCAWWDWALRLGFFVTLAFTVVHIVTSHIVQPAEDE